MWKNLFREKPEDTGEWERGPLPTEEQRRLLGELMYQAFVDVRQLCWNGKALQAADLADAIHNLPVEMYSSLYSWAFQKHLFAFYQQKYSGETRDYAASLEEIRKVG